MVLYVCVEIETAVVVVLGVHATVFPSVCTATCFGQHVQRIGNNSNNKISHDTLTHRKHIARSLA